MGGHNPNLKLDKQMINKLDNPLNITLTSECEDVFKEYGGMSDEDIAILLSRLLTYKWAEYIQDPDMCEAICDFFMAIEGVHENWMLSSRDLSANLEYLRCNDFDTNIKGYDYRFRNRSEGNYAVNRILDIGGTYNLTQELTDAWVEMNGSYPEAEYTFDKSVKEVVVNGQRYNVLKDHDTIVANPEFVEWELVKETN